MGDEKHYHDWVAFSQREMDSDSRGWQGVLQKHLLSRTENADALFIRTYAGFLHPLKIWGLESNLFNLPSFSKH